MDGVVCFGGSRPCTSDFSRSNTETDGVIDGVVEGLTFEEVGTVLVFCSGSRPSKILVVLLATEAAVLGLCLAGKQEIVRHRRLKILVRPGEF